MTTLWADSFEDYAIADMGKDYSVAQTGSFTLLSGRRAGTSAVQVAAYNHGLGGAWFQRSFPAPVSTLFMSCTIKINFKPGVSVLTTYWNILFQEGVITHVGLRINDAGQIVVYRGEAGTLLGSSASGVFLIGSWKWIQVKVVIHDSTGSVEIRDASGQVLLLLENQDTRNAGNGNIDGVRLGSSESQNGTGALASYDDLHIWDTTGSICNTWTNDTRVDHLRPNAPGDSAQFTPTSGANWTCVDEAQLNTTDWVESTTLTHKDLYHWQDILHAPSNIWSVMRTAAAVKIETGVLNIKFLTKSVATLNTGSAITVDEGNYVRYFDILETDPNTSAEWTKAGFNAAQHGHELA